MILAALTDYYHRRRQQAGRDAPPPFGYSSERVSFALVLSADGQLRDVVDLRKQDEKGRKHAVSLQVPRPLSGRTSGVRAYFLCDNTRYLLGVGGDKPARDLQTFEASRDKHLIYLAESDDPGAQALRRFFESWDPAQADRLPLGDELASATCVFKLDGTPGYVHDRPALREIWQARFADENETAPRQCLVTGEERPAALLHPPIKGVPNAQTSGAYLVSFNAEAFCSYSAGTKAKGLNAPVSQEAAFAYTTALNELLRWDSPQKLPLGHTAVVFWAERETPFEPVVPALFGGGDRSGLSKEVRERVSGVLAAVERGQPPADALSDLDRTVRFYVLGLGAPSQARLTVRFWLVTNLGRLLEGVRQHHADLAIERRFANQPATPSLWRLVAETAPDHDLNEALPQLHAGLLHAVLTGAPYPTAVLPAVFARIRADCGRAQRLPDDPISHPRVALIAACLRRIARTQGRVIPREVEAMSLDTETEDVPYRLGRLFAAMEKAQQDALGRNINHTIRDGYFATASAAPRAVFPRLLRLTQHHIAKADYGHTSDRRIAEIVETLTPGGAFPAQLTFEQQGRFVLGYYHQRNALYRKADAVASEPPERAAAEEEAQ
jgi:CRISPR-associated protein Csd1